jgi:hypothetical protein
METLGTLGFVGGIIVGIIAAIIFQTGLAFLFFFALGVALIIWGQIYIHKNSPKFKKVDRKQVIIDAPAVGEIRFANY